MAALAWAVGRPHRTTLICLGLWLLGILGWLPNGDRYALVFGAWVATTELVPYIGPWLGAIPPFLYALVVHPLAALWVTL